MWLWIVIVPLGIVLLIVLSVLCFLWGTRYGLPFSRQRRGRIEGTLWLDGKRAPAGEWVACGLSRPTGLGKNGPFSMAMWNLYTQTDAYGRFAFAHVSPGEARLGRAFGTGPALKRLPFFDGGNPYREMHYSRECRVSVAARETTQVTLGEGTVTLRGQFVIPGMSAEAVNWANINHGASRLGPGGPHYPVPPEGLSGDESSAWYEALPDSEEYRRWCDQQSRIYTVSVEVDGHFLVHNVHAGTYVLKAQVDRCPPPRFGGRRRPLGYYTCTIEVDSPEDGKHGTFDLGMRSMTPFAECSPGDTLPALTVSTVHGGEIDLSDFRGKYFLLATLWPCQGDSIGFMKRLAPIAQRYGDGVDLDILVLSMDDEEVDHPNYIGMDSSIYSSDLDVQDVVRPHSMAVASALGVLDTSLFLVDPDGKIIAIEHDPKAMREPLRQVKRWVAAS